MNSTDDKAALVGQQVGEYQVETLRWQRSTHWVYQAATAEHHPVFLLALTTTTDEDPELAGRFQRRMRTVGQIQHPNIASVLEVDVSEAGRPYAVISFIDGETLAESLETWSKFDRRLSPVEILSLVRELAEALSAAHPAGIIHHNLRPENILLTKENIPILIDLGVPISGAVSRSKAGKGQENTLDYASPEQLGGKPLSGQSNIYSLGILLYRLLAGHRPRLPHSDWDIFERTADNLPKEIPLEKERSGLSRETYQLVADCLWRPEWSRFETINKMKAAIDKALEAEKTPRRPVIEPIVTQSRRRWPYVVIPVIILVLVLLVWFLFLSP